MTTRSAVLAALVFSIGLAGCGGSSGRASLAPPPTLDRSSGGTQTAPAPATEPTPTAASSVQAEPTANGAVATIEFGRAVEVRNRQVGLLDAGSRFRPNREFAYRVRLPAADPTAVIHVQILDSAGNLVLEDEASRRRGFFYGTASLSGATGDYTMRLLRDGAIVAEGVFAIRGRPITTPTSPAAPEPQPEPEPEPEPEQANCDPSYPTLCLPSAPDIDCGEISARRFPVVGRDPHGFDGDGDGVGCES